MKYPLGAILIFFLALISTTLVLLLPHKEPEGITFWVYTLQQRDAYTEPIAHWNNAHPKSRFEMSLLHANAIERRMLSGFLSGTPMADLLETHEGMYPKAYLGPLDQIGFLDITDRLHEEGLYSGIAKFHFCSTLIVAVTSGCRSLRLLRYSPTAPI